MFPGKGVLTLTKILNGLSKSLNIAGQIVPIYNSISPMITKAKNTFSLLRELNIPEENVKNSDNKKITTNTSSSNFNNPKFFI